MLKNGILKFRNELFRDGYGSAKWKKKFGKFGENTRIEYPVILQGTNRIFVDDESVILKNARLQNYNTDGDNGIYIGKDCYLGFNLSILNAGKIIIGNSVLMASNVLISSENHGMNPELDIPYMNQKLSSNNVKIKDGVWIGQNVCILPGVTIGKKSIIGAGSIVTKSVPDYSIAVGNPAKVIKKYNFKSHRWEKSIE